MRRYIYFFGLLVVVLHVSSVPFSFAWDIPKQIPGDFEGKWYGIHCPLVDPKDMFGERGGDAFPNQKIINAWGYKAKPIEEIKDLIPEQYYDIATHPQLWGNIRVNETAYIPSDQWPGTYVKLRNAATEKYKGQAYLDEDGNIQNHTAGQPFPGSTKDNEIIWNFMRCRPEGETYFARFYTAITDRKGSTRYCVAEQNYLYWKGKFYGENAPAITPNPNNYYSFQAMGFWEPYDLRGIIILTHRYDDAKRMDDQWMYITSLRRVRRMSAAQRWDKLPGGQDITYDGAMGFDGKPTNYEWKYLGRKMLLCGHNATNRLMEIKGKPGGGCCDQTYQRVNCIVLQFTPKIVSSVSRGILYMDPDLYCIYYADYYDKRGRPYLFYAHSWVVGNDGCIGLVGFLVSDVQRVHSSNNYTYDSFKNELAIKEGRDPNYFNMNNLKSIYKGR